MGILLCRRWRSCGGKLPQKDSATACGVKGAGACNLLLPADVAEEAVPAVGSFPSLLGDGLVLPLLGFLASPPGVFPSSGVSEELPEEVFELDDPLPSSASHSSI